MSQTSEKSIKTNFSSKKNKSVEHCFNPKNCFAFHSCKTTTSRRIFREINFTKIFVKMNFTEILSSV